MKMERLLPVLAASAFLMLPFSVKAAAEEAPAGELKTPVEKFSYMVGMDVGRSVKGLAAEIDLAVFMRALEDVLKDRPTLLTPEQAEELRNDFMAKKQQEAEAANKVLAAKNLAEGDVFLASNKTKEGVKTTASGLQYEVIEEGDGPKPKATDSVKVDYRGTLIDGTEFDSSYKRGEPAAFPLEGVIAGWGEGLQLMPVGSTYKFFIPPSLAYGDRSAGPDIGPNSTLIFEVKLLEIIK